MPTPIRESIPLDSGITLALYRWGEADRRPAALLTHGTGFCAAVWQTVAEALSADFAVYAIDRRGHGSSSKPVDAYHFADFAADVVELIDRLRLSDAYAIGHSAGATDLLLASAARPQAFRCIFAMEPTIHADRAAALPAQNSDALHAEFLETAARRRATFGNHDEALVRYRTRPAFDAWQPELLRAYVHHGFEQQADGTVTLCCTPAIERAMLIHIVRAMAGTYRGDAGSDPFEALERVACPTRIATTEFSHPIYKEMAARALRRIPSASTRHFEGVGHTVAQAQPAIVVSAVRQFWAENDPARR